jgi:hypothetical protein
MRPARDWVLRSTPPTEAVSDIGSMVGNCWPGALCARRPRLQLDHSYVHVVLHHPRQRRRSTGGNTSLGTSSFPGDIGSYGLIGSPETIRERIAAYADAGVQALVLRFHEPFTTDIVRWFASEFAVTTPEFAVPVLT